MKVLLLSAYGAQSHRQWQESITQMFAQWSWHILELPPRHFSWRIRGNPLYWAMEERDVLNQKYDLLLATSMVDLATLRGLVPALAQVPTVLYFHENQFVYPQREGQQSLLEAQMVTLYAGLAADLLLFNSSYNCRTYIEGVDALLERLPDYVPTNVAQTLQKKSAVIPVPPRLPGTISSTTSNLPYWATTDEPRPLRLLWLGRFEHDKGGDRLLALLRRIEGSNLDYELAVVGQQFRNSPPEFAQIEREFSVRLVQFGYLEDRSQYEALLASADIVLSTATHEFQGLAVMEAVAAGCLPVLPDRLAYAEIYPDDFRYASHLDDIEQEADAAAHLIEALVQQGAVGSAKFVDMLAELLVAYTPAELAPRYQCAFESVCNEDAT